jgi:hypothetical protein
VKKKSYFGSDFITRSQKFFQNFFRCSDEYNPNMYRAKVSDYVNERMRVRMRMRMRMRMRIGCLGALVDFILFQCEIREERIVGWHS